MSGAWRYGMLCFFFNDTATTEIYTLSLHDALPISVALEALKSRLAVNSSSDISKPYGSRIELDKSIRQIGRAHV